MNTKLSK